MSALPMLQGLGGKSLDELISELTQKTFTFIGGYTSKIVLPETGIYLVILPTSVASVAAYSGLTPLIRPTKITNNSSTGGSYTTSYYYALLQSNQAGSFWATNGYIGASGDTSGYILAKIKEL